MRGLEGDADANNDNQITAVTHSFVTDKVERQSGFKQTPDLQGDATAYSYVFTGLSQQRCWKETYT